MRKRVLRNKALLRHIAVSVFLATVVLPGCANKGPILTDFQYLPSAPAAGAKQAVTAIIAPFKDSRGKVDCVVGKRSNSVNDQSNELVVQGTVAGKVSAALGKALAARGMAVSEAAGWDLSESDIGSGGADLLIGGEIKVLWIESVSQLANTVVTTDVQLRIVVADVAQKKIIRVLNVNSKVERQNVAFIASFVERTLSEALTGAIDQVFSDEEVKKRIK